jgi:thiamine biosynthesis lipoprotein
LAACGGDDVAAGPLVLHELRGPTMGSAYVLKWHGGDSPALVKAAVERLLDQVDVTFSNWRTDSEIARFNMHRSTEPFVASAMLRRGVAIALQLAKCTDGAFDPTVHPLSELYRGMKQSGMAPTREAQAAAHARVGHGALQIDGESLRKTRVDLAIDLDGLVAGLAADGLRDELDSLGVRNFMLEITGEVLCRGVRPDQKPWRIGVVDPEHATVGAEGSRVSVPVADRALCTSGDYRNFAIQDGRVVTHVFDPRTAENPTHGIVSATVLARSCALADGLGTALMVVGPERAAAVLSSCGEPDVAAFLMIADEQRTLRSVEVAWPEAFALDGRPLLRPSLIEDARRQRESDLDAAMAALQQAPDSLAAILWVGRRLGYLGYFRDAVANYSAGLLQFADEPHLLRHRGHRHLTLRDFDSARSDLQRAAAAVAGKDLEVEPDGQPVAGRPPHSTLQYNIHYHLGIACFCLRDFPAAEAAFRDCLLVSQNDESRVAATHWLWCALAQQNRAGEAAAFLAAIPKAPLVVENVDYLRLCRLYSGATWNEGLVADRQQWSAALDFGVAHFELMRAGIESLLVEPSAAAARRSLEGVARRADWPSFGVVAAEALLAPR